jgi:REP element-mobilizing transposase RayT
MARSVRIEFAGAYYHVMARGNRREAIFLDDDDRRFFLKTLSEACGRTGWRVHAWVLMGNHYHLFIETPEGNLVEGMKWLQNTYTRRFNIRHRKWGRLFGDRYKAVLVEGKQPRTRDAGGLHPSQSGASGADKAEGRREHSRLSVEQRDRRVCACTATAGAVVGGGDRAIDIRIAGHCGGKEGDGGTAGPPCS